MDNLFINQIYKRNRN